MLNLADFSMLLMALIGPLSAFTAAHAHKAGVSVAILFALGGLALGISLGRVTSKLAYRVLDSKGLHGGLAFFAYLAIPLVGILAVTLAPFLVAEIIYGHT
jgi:hypothetical protein